MKYILLTISFLTLFVYAGKSQANASSSDLFLTNASIQSQAGTSINTNMISYSQVVRFRVGIGNLGPDAPPVGHYQVIIGLGDGFILNPGYNLATAPLSNYFSWSYDNSGSQPIIIGNSIASLPVGFGQFTFFELKATNVTTSTVSANLLITNPINTDTPLSDPQSGNNFTGNNYVVGENLVLTAVTQATTCYNGSNGSISASAVGGFTPYTFSITPASGTQSSPGIFTGLSAGDYTVRVTDAANNSKDTIVTVNQPPNVTGSGSVTSNYNNSQISCPSSTDGQVTVVASGGTGTLSYALNNGSYQASGIFNNLGAGNYTPMVKDVNGCIFSLASVTITAPTAISGTGAVTSNYNGSQLSCNTSTDGTVTVTATGGTGALQYAIDGGVYQTSNVFSGLAAGVHTLLVKDANGCTFAPASVTITAPTAISGSGAVTSNYNGSQLSCNTSTDGAITVTATGGTGTLSYAIDGGTYQTSNVFSGLAAGTHTLLVKDANGCTFAPASVTITAPPAIGGSGAVTSNYNGSQLSCNTSTDGAITVTATGGTGVLQYAIDGGVYQTSNVFNGLAAGTHTLIVKDANGCAFAPASVTITAPTAIGGSGAVTSNYNGSQLSCNTSTDGAITVTANGGTGALQYAIDGGVYQTSNMFSGLAAGTHTLLVKDVNGCTFAPASVTIIAPAAIGGTGAVTSNYNGSQLSCNTSTDGTITVTANGGTGALQYAIDGGTYQTNNVFSGLAAGTHTLLVKDANGCTFAPASVTITAPSSVSATASATTINCNGGSSTLTIAGSGGTGVLTYVVNPGSLSNTNGTFPGLLAGTYTYTVTDANNCVPATGSVTISQPSAIAVSASKTDALCNGSSNGSITLSATGGSSPYAYTITGAGTNTSGATSGVFTNLPAGNYSYSVTDVNGCTPATGSITISQPTAIAATATPAAATCFGVANGQATISATGGSGSYTYTLTGVGSNQTGTFTNLAAGNYDFSVTDANNCTPATGSFTIVQPTIISTASAGKTDALCNGSSNGSISLQGAGGTAPYVYTITGPGANNSGTTSGVFTSLPAGNYSYSITDVNNCAAATGSLIIGQPDAISTATSSSVSATCFGASNGAISLQGAGGTSPYTYTISGAGANTSGATTGTFTGLPAGTYSYSITDANTCTPATGSITVGQPAAVTASSSTNSATCFGNSNGSITLTGLGGTSPYTYSVTGRGSNQTGVFTGLPAGNYTYSVTDANACTPATGSVTVGQPAAAVSLALTNKTNNTCRGGMDGSFKVTASGGSGSYTYTITSGPTINTSGSATGIFTGLAAGTYSVSVSDVNGCAAVYNGIVITEPSALNPDGSISIANFTDNIFPANNSSIVVVFQVTENAGNPIPSALLRITKQDEYDYSFLTQQSISVRGITYPLSNASWTADNSNPIFYDLNMNSGSQVNCQQSVYLGVRITRSTTNRTNFTLTSLLQNIAGETFTLNNNASFICVSQ